MIELKEHGYTPNNFRSLVSATGLTNKAFIDKFKLKRSSFYLYKNGQVTMQYDDWLELLKKVKKYLENNN